MFVLLANEKSIKEHEEYAYVQKQLMHLGIFIRVYLSSKHRVIGSSRRCAVMEIVLRLQ